MGLYGTTMPHLLPESIKVSCLKGEGTSLFTRSNMLKYEIFIWKSTAIDGFPSCAIVVCKVTSLK